MSAAPDPSDNGLLAALPEAERARWLPQLEPIELGRGHVLYESGQVPTHLVFPATAVVSLLYVMENGASAEIGLVGREGAVGLSLILGGGSTPSRALVQQAGLAWQLPAQALRQAATPGGPAHGLLLRYGQAMLTQIAQNAVCSRHHALDQQLCRWLLLNLDRVSGPELVVTHGLIASLLGVRRESITETALKLQSAGLIRYVRGHITVLDRPGLEQRSCECYGVVRKEYERLLPTPGGRR